jgi:RIO kinase 1
MDQSRNTKYYNDLDDEGRFDYPGKFSRRPPKRHSAHAPVAIQQFVQNQDDSRRTFTYTYKAARFEEGWLLDSLGYFYEQHWISDVLRKVRAGKEASVYLCRAGTQVDAPLVAAKVYRPRMLRNLRNDHIYQEGRSILDDEGHEVNDTHSLHAVIKRSNFGEQVRHQSWIAYEYTALQALHAAGANVPRPYEMAHNAILMDYLGDEAGGAPTLNEVDLAAGEAQSLFDRLLHNLDLMLACGHIHGDLSAYNVLYWDGDISLIDFPQVVSPRGNRNAYAIFERDITRLCEYFIRQGLRLHPRRLAAQVWTAHGYTLRPDVHPGLLDADDPADRQYWKQMEKTS